MSKLQWAGQDLLRIVKSKKKYTDTFVKRYWRHQLLPEQQSQLLGKILSIAPRLSSRIHFLKFLVYLHVMLTTRCQHSPNETILTLCFKSKSQQMSQFDNLLFRVTTPYLMYIQKRTMKAQVVRGSPKGLSHLQLLEVAFQLVNLINLGCSFCKEIYKFGRYYSEEYPFLSDLNTVLGMDLRECYATLRGCVSRLWANFKNQPKQTQHVLNSLVDQINTTNEKLFIVFYNTYFYTELKNFLPNWIRYEPKDVGEDTEVNKKQSNVGTQLNIQSEFNSPPPRKRTSSKIRSEFSELSIMELQKLMMDNTLQIKNPNQCSTIDKTPGWQSSQLEQIEISDFNTTKEHLLASTQELS